MKQIESLQRDSPLKFFEAKNNEIQQTSNERGPHNTYKQDASNSLFNEDSIADQNNRNKKENYSNEVNNLNRSNKISEASYPYHMKI